ncbi:MAG: ribonuclease Z [Lachnospiraceae bacterium]|jgi:ribonuclease Z|nr:ribonuclease Z [Lachnospiraceae bacterium]
MIDISLLGTGGMMPLPKRWLTSLLLRYNGSSLLIDCGEGTQIALREVGWSFKPIDTILLTHFHADHISGLPGMFLTMGNADRTDPVTVIGPKGVERVIAAVRVMAPELPFEIRCVPIDGNEQEFDVSGLKVKAFRVNHNIPCYGYSVSLARAGRFDTEAAKAADIPLKFWNPLQKGSTIEYEGRTLTPDMVMGGARKGLKLTYCTDTRPTKSIVDNASGSDLFICEGMYGDPEKEAKAKDYRHMTMEEAANLARDAGVKEMWLTHYSPSLVRPSEYMEKVRKIFPNAAAAKDGRTAVLNFEDEDE